ncbi:serine hydrolase domain-containing protein [Ktedonobacter racemifer]|uniref:Beta-lactamase n=1 Tax=Ktedonobacter racemifer DSM 44963 TaxID=485913 RepID=D6TTG6_KTERA|nr:serine hydrolase [Ktedonobacter racemifer]EFH83717.1 beta-lactamase [Ktedonobacter racemifer DSM 44963]
MTLNPLFNWPTREWATALPETLGVNGDILCQLDAEAQNIEKLLSILVIRSGAIVFEGYYHGGQRDLYHNVNSVTKSVLATLIGIALEKGYFHSLDQSLLSFFPEYTPANLDERKQRVTLRHLLTMTSGLQAPSDDTIDHFLEDSATIQRLLDLPMRDEPGEVYYYNSVDPHLLTILLTRVTGMTTAQFARTYLFDTLGIWCDSQGNPDPWLQQPSLAGPMHPFGLSDGHLPWAVDVQGYYIGAFGLRLTTREMAKLGYLYLMRGRWGEQQVLSSAFIEEATSEHTRTPRNDGYGYYWYRSGFAGYSAECAIGFGGQIIAVLPQLDLVVATTCEPVPGSPTRRLLEDFIVPACKPESV